MIKRILILTLCFVAAFSCLVCAEEIAQQTEAYTSVQEETAQQRPENMSDMPQGNPVGRGMPGGGRHVGQMSQGDMPQREMPFGNNQPLQEAAENTQQNNMSFDENASGAENLTGKNQTVPVQGQNPFDREHSGGENFGNMNGTEVQTVQEAPLTFSDILKEYSSAFISVVLLALAFVFVIFYKRKNY